jgi:hypothetical protein
MQEMASAPDPARETHAHVMPRRTAPLIGAGAGAVAGLLVAALVDLVEGGVTPVAYLGGALVGAVIGFVLAMLVPAEIDDGEGDAHAAPFGSDGRPRSRDLP